VLDRPHLYAISLQRFLCAERIDYRTARQHLEAKGDSEDASTPYPDKPLDSFFVPSTTTTAQDDTVTTTTTAEAVLAVAAGAESGTSSKRYVADRNNVTDCQ
jgi:hypothetical protein